MTISSTLTQLKFNWAIIPQVRAGKATESFITSDISSHFPEECAFSIVYGDYKNLDLIASSADDANVWITGDLTISATDVIP